MIEFERLAGPLGIPVYFQRLPMVNGVSLKLLVGIGSADDESVGKPGLYHWFEHVPFRGTRRFPGGYAATKGWLTRFAGGAGAWTSATHTCYSAFVPKQMLKQGLDLVVDLSSQPLLLNDAIESERKIIAKEIVEALGDAQDFSSTKVPEILFGDHPLAHSVLGEDETLQAMTPDTLREAHARGYDYSRMVLFAAGDITPKELLRALKENEEFLPDNGLTARRSAIHYGALPAWQGGKRTETETDFASSAVFALFPAPPKGGPINPLLIRTLAAQMCARGGTSSPLYRELREKRSLVYSTSVHEASFADGGFWGFRADTGAAQIEDVAEAFREVINSKELRSQERLDEVVAGFIAQDAMLPIDPSLFTSRALSRFMYYGTPLGDMSLNRFMSELTLGDLNDFWETLSSDKQHTIIFRGKK